MARVCRLTLSIVVLLALTALVCSAAVNPTVSFSFDPANFEYSWTVTCTTATTVPFYQFTVGSLIPQAVWNGLATSNSGPWVGAQNAGWNFVPAPGTATNMSLKWEAPSGQGVVQGTNWSGTFKLVVPNTTPVTGQVKTYGGTIYYQYLTSSVPGIVPEPSSLAVFGSMIAGLVPFAIRRRK